MATIADILTVSCPTCKRPADSHCVDPEISAEGEGVHNTRIYRYKVVTDATAHNQELTR